MKFLRTLAHTLLLACFALIALSGSVIARDAQSPNVVAYQDLPPEAHRTIALIRAGGPFPFSKDGTVFSNRERRLPLKPRGYYREYTVITPDARNRGARRIVVGRPTEMYYTADHYETFRLIVGAP